ncbi:helix-turn-helix transcriptional regulator [Chloroflexales bacterium ZM16-3]|nr:helix-turn-helix transcriptional regulator [Chloroflexales bacterium ZM16-3]
MIANLGKKIRSLREDAAISQTELAIILGLSPTSKGVISEVESGKKLPGIEFVLQIAERFGVSTDYLLRDDIPIRKTDDRTDNQQSITQ